MTSKDTWYNTINEFATYVYQYIGNQVLANGGQYNDNCLVMSYYDGLYIAYKLHDYFPGLHPGVGTEVMYASYGTYYGYNNSPGAHFTLPGYWVFGEGLAERYLRTNNAIYLQDLTDLNNNAAFSMTGTLPADNTRHTLNREWAYCGMTKLQLKRVASLTGPQQARLDQVYSDSLLIVNDWSTGVASYFRPFMGGLTAHFLVMYYELEADSGKKATILAALQGLATYCWNTCWVPAAASFKYTDRYVSDPSDTVPTADLSMLVAPLYSWLWSVTGVQDWKTKGNQVFEGSVPIYSGPWWQSGAYLGTRDPSGPIGKHVNQQAVWGVKYFDYDAAQGGGGGGGGGGHPTLAPLGIILGCGGPVGAAETRVIALSGSLAIGNVAVGSTGTATLTITNNGANTLTIYSITYPTGFSGIYSGTIAPAAHADVTVTFTPLAVQAYSGTVTVNSDATSGTNTRACSGTGTGSGTWNPASYGTLVWWGDFTDPTKVLHAGSSATNGQTINTLTDKSGNAANFTQGTDANAPTCATAIVNGLQVASYTGSVPDYLSSTSAEALSANRAGLSFVTVFNTSSVAATQMLFEFYGGTGKYRIRLGILATGTPYSEGYAQDAGSQYQLFASATVTTSVWHVFQGTYNFSNTQLNLWLDGVQCLTNGNLQSSGLTTNTNGSVPSNLGYYPGLTGYLAELIWWDSALSGATISSMYTAIKTKYGL